MTHLPDEEVRQNVATLRLDLGARAAGYWWLAGNWLEQISFVASPALREEVAQRFAEATRSIPTSKLELGIVRAALTGVPAISRVDQQGPDDTGSGYWLHAFDATRSVAVPLHDLKGKVRAVIVVALAENDLDDETVVEQILAAVRNWSPLV
ncbi:hypothetical protein SAMN05444166_5534 [Singulisphaera sp. GP187]|uniref:hypothetical protein n=1 Tax=Singulisphaera sp. GP187 TaxID=1882752 RepID=UPI00092AA16A|nr:hypothetical protein [Singulisphaera sp. GP187]SIO57965.1 hypothetical protein SAMN05444166_5534 [Singulisphaera sp. GP187]